jgi:hypothetical protein
LFRLVAYIQWMVRVRVEKSPGRTQMQASESTSMAPFERSQISKSVVGAAARAGIVVLGCLAVPAPAAAREVIPSLKPDTSFDARWDRCEALARQRGTPPAKIGYGDFMEACMGKTSPQSDAASRAANGGETTGAAATKRQR